MPLAAALDALIDTHLVQAQRAMEELLERVTYALANEADAASVYAALDRAEKQLDSLMQFLISSGLGGLPVNQEGELTRDEMVATSRRLFEQRARMSEATALVSSIFSPL